MLDFDHQVDHVFTTDNDVDPVSTKVVGKKKMYNTPDSPEMPVTAELLPAKYNDKSDRTFDVKRGSNEKNWATG